ncbi:MAG: chemotaxis-specific protein-glutamate methyltransferase CheB [Bacteroidetes bacterium]|nr:chemotaxis-specific protein-glutamate methyltransferase CheB [Bacteroidota bacterium]
MPLKKISVLIVDDSPTVRDIFRAIFESDPDVEVIGEAANGQEAIDFVAKDRPSIITMDVFMPIMNGPDAIQHIMGNTATPILVVTTAKDATLAFQCLSKGALEVIEKPDFAYIQDEIKRKGLITKLKSLSRVPVVTHMAGKTKTVREPVAADLGNRRILAICSSTGGPKALSILLGQIPGDFPYPIVITQHMYEGFIDGLVEWLQTTTPLKVKVAEQGEILKSGVVFVAPTGKHLEVSMAETIRLTNDPLVEGHRPSGEKLFSSVAAVYGKKAIGVILTGMGGDGSTSLGLIKKAGGFTIAQDEKSCVVFGMPKEAIAKGSATVVLPLTEIAPAIIKHLSHSILKV